jgi:predicted MFS family arabinose efflux permease
MGVLAIISKLLEAVSLSVYYITGGAFIVIAALLIMKLPTSVGATEVEPPRMLVKSRYWLYYVLTFIQGSRKQALGTFITLVLVDTFGLKVWNISILLLVSSAVNMLTAPYIGHLIDRLGERRMVPLSYVLLTVCCVGFAVIRNVWALAILSIAIKLLVMFGMGLSTYVRRIAPPEELTPTLSAGISINHVTSVAMPLVAGSLLSVIGYEGIFLGTAAIIMISVPFALGLQTGSPPAAGPEVATAG